jgi:hypothetical protein
LKRLNHTIKRITNQHVTIGWFITYRTAKRSSSSPSSDPSIISRKNSNGLSGSPFGISLIKSASPKKTNTLSNKIVNAGYAPTSIVKISNHQYRSVTFPYPTQIPSPTKNQISLPTKAHTLKQTITRNASCLKPKNFFEKVGQYNKNNQHPIVIIKETNQTVNLGCWLTKGQKKNSVNSEQTQRAQTLTASNTAAMSSSSPRSDLSIISRKNSNGLSGESNRYLNSPNKTSRHIPPHMLKQPITKKSSRLILKTPFKKCRQYNKNNQHPIVIINETNQTVNLGCWLTKEEKKNAINSEQTQKIQTLTHANPKAVASQNTLASTERTYHPAKVSVGAPFRRSIREIAILLSRVLNTTLETLLIHNSIIIEHRFDSMRY